MSVIGVIDSYEIYVANHKNDVVNAVTNEIERNQLQKQLPKEDTKTVTTITEITVANVYEIYIANLINNC